MKDTRSFEELSEEEQQHLQEWAKTFLFPTMNGGLSMGQIQEECWFSTGQRDQRPGWEGYEDLWRPSPSAILSVMERLGYKQQAIKIIAGPRKGEITLFYNVQLYTTCLPPRDPLPREGTMRERWDWSVADEVRERETQKAKETAYTWSDIVMAPARWTPEEPLIQQEGRVTR